MSHSRECTIVYKSLPHYRVDFYDRLRERLAGEGVRLRLIVGQPDTTMAARRDTGALPWAETIRNRYLGFGPQKLIWQPCLRSLRSSDLVVVEQASKLLANYALLAWRSFGGPKVAWWGHGINLDREKASRAGEAVKHRLAGRADWWFCYTEGTARIVADFGVSRDRITVVQNAVDTSTIRGARARVTSDDIIATRREFGIGDCPVGIWLSSVYDQKRPEFMVESADLIRQVLTDFEFVVIGDGPRRTVFDEAAETRPWLHVLGARNGLDAVRPAATASILVNPGLVGLTVLDGFALGLPMITRDTVGHSPEIEYLEHDVNGLVLAEHATPADFAQACVRLLTDEQELARLSKAAREASFRYTLDEMVERFANGILRALESEPTRSVRRKRRKAVSSAGSMSGEPA